MRDIQKGVDKTNTVMYYPEAVTEQVKAKNDIEDVIKSYTQVENYDGTLFGKCIFDDKSSMSLLISKSTQTFQCIEPTCKANGDVIEFVRRAEDCSLVEAVQKLADRASINLPEPLRSEFSTSLAINREAALYFYHNLKKEPSQTGMDYLHERGMTDDTIRRFGLGYDGPRPDGLYHHLIAKGFTNEQIETAGLAKNGYDAFKGRVICPVIDTEGNVLGFSGRIIGDGMPKYKNSATTDLYDKRSILFGMNIAQHSNANSLILCEGNFDVVSLHQAGFDNAVAPMGTALTREQIALMSANTQRVHLIFDSDEAGVRATMRAISMLRDSKIQTDVVSLSPHKDPDEFIKAEGAKAFQERLDKAESSISFEVNHKYTQYDLHDSEQELAMKKEFAHDVLSAPESLQEQYLNAMDHYIEHYDEIMKDQKGEAEVQDDDAPADESAEEGEAELPSIAIPENAVTLDFSKVIEDYTAQL